MFTVRKTQISVVNKKVLLRILQRI